MFLMTSPAGRTDGRNAIHNTVRTRSAA